MEDLTERLLKRAEIRRSIKTRKSVQEGKPDRIADLLEESSDYIKNMDLRFKALLEGLDVHNTHFWMNQTPENLKILGKEISDQAKRITNGKST